MITTSADKTARLWDADSGLQVGPSLSHDGAVLHAAFSPDGAMLGSCGADGVAKLWPLKSDMNDLDMSVLLKVWAGWEVSESGLRVLDATWRHENKNVILALNKESKTPSRFVSWSLTANKDRALYPECARTVEMQITHNLDHIVNPEETSFNSLQQANTAILNEDRGDSDFEPEEIVLDSYETCPEHPLVHLAMLKLKMTSMSERELLQIAKQNIIKREDQDLSNLNGVASGTHRARAIAYLMLMDKQVEAQKMLEELISRLDPERKSWGNVWWCRKCSFWPYDIADAYLKVLQYVDQKRAK